jgi:DNA polymerase-3 subunit epsilon
MKKENWVLIDTETTGLSSSDWTIEVCVQQMRGWSSVGRMKSWLIRVPKRVGRGALKIHGISNEHLDKHGDDPFDAHEEIIECIDGQPYGAFNLPFDSRMLNADWDRVNVAKRKRPRAALCALRLSRLFLDDSPGYRLDTLASHYKLKTRPKHRASFDVKSTVELLDRMMKPRTAGYSFFDLVELCELPIKEAREVVGRG